MAESKLLLASRCCDQCLTTPQRIVSGDRAAQIVRECKADGNHFFCHKGMDQKVHCRGVHDALGGSRAYHFAKRMGIPVEEVDPNDYG